MAAAAVCCYVVEVRAPASRRDRQLAWGWWVVAAAFTLLSLDELGSLHERVGEVSRLNLFAGRLISWVGVLAFPIAAVALLLLLFAWTRMRRSPSAFFLFVLGVLLLLTVPLQEHAEFSIPRMAGKAAEQLPRRRPPGYLVLEEGTR